MIGEAPRMESTLHQLLGTPAQMLYFYEVFHTCPNIT